MHSHNDNAGTNHDFYGAQHDDIVRAIDDHVARYHNDADVLVRRVDLDNLRTAVDYGIGNHLHRAARAVVDNARTADH